MRERERECERVRFIDVGEKSGKVGVRDTFGDREIPVEREGGREEGSSRHRLMGREREKARVGEMDRWGRERERERE